MLCNQQSAETEPSRRRIQEGAKAGASMRFKLSGLGPPVARVQRQLLGDAPSVEAPGLSKTTVDAANLYLTQRKWQEAVDVIVGELIRTGAIDPSLIEGGRIHFEAPVSGEGITDPLGFRRTAGGLQSLRNPIRLGESAFKRGFPWLYSSILHEYHHILQLKDPRGLRTIYSVVPGQAGDPVLIHQQEVESYAEEIFQASQTGEAAHPKDMRTLWKRLHLEHWSQLGPSERKIVRDVYIRAHTAAEAILGPGSLPGYAPGPP
jgi:hypothetical protein